MKNQFIYDITCCLDLNLAIYFEKIETKWLKCHLYATHMIVMQNISRPCLNMYNT